MRLEKVITILKKELKIKLEKKGSNFFFVCPFHDDKNPSLSFEATKMFFKCFGCDFKARNIYYFWSSYKNISIEETFKNLNDLGYIKNFFERKTISQRNNDHLKALETFSNIYINNLSTFEGREILFYLTNKRKIDKKTLNFFRIGASISSKQLTKILQRKENEEIAKKAIELNLVVTKKNENFDFLWRKQVVIPIENENGEIVLFSSRKISDGDNKYIFLPSNKNVSEKSSTIYNYRRVANNNKENFCYLVEGFFDVFSLYENKIENCISLLGTSISKKQEEMISKLKKKILIFFDGDRAGIEGSILISSALMKKGIDCEIIETKEGKDPDEICKEGLIREAIKNKINPFTFSILYYYRAFEIKNNPQRSIQFIKKISQIFYWVKEDIRNFITDKISNLLVLRKEEVKKVILKEMEEAEGFEPSRVL